MIDDIDARILAILQNNARTNTAEIARRLEMAASAIHERIRKLEERGVIMGYTARIDPRAVGLGLLAFVFVRTEERTDEAATAERLRELPEVQEIHHVAGEDCYLVKVRARDTEALGRLLQERFATIPTVRSTRTTVVLNSILDSGRLPVAERAEEAVPSDR